jgi:hypothetical protein
MSTLDRPILPSSKDTHIRPSQKCLSVQLVFAWYYLARVRIGNASFFLSFVKNFRFSSGTSIAPDPMQVVLIVS